MFFYLEVGKIIARNQGSKISHNVDGSTIVVKFFFQTFTWKNILVPSLWELEKKVFVFLDYFVHAAQLFFYVVN